MLQESYVVLVAVLLQAWGPHRHHIACQLVSSPRCMLGMPTVQGVPLDELVLVMLQTTRKPTSWAAAYLPQPEKTHCLEVQCWVGRGPRQALVEVEGGPPTQAARLV